MLTLSKLFESTDERLNESPASDRHEAAVADSIAMYFKRNNLPYSADRPVAASTFPDVKITDIDTNKTITWAEVKMNHNDRLYNGRFQVRNGRWLPQKTDGMPNPIGDIIGEALNADSMAQAWLLRIAKFLNKDVSQINMPSSNSVVSRLEGEDALKVRDFLENQRNPDSGTGRGNKLVTNQFGSNLEVAKLVVMHYTSSPESGGKAAQSAYIQTGDDFYQFKSGLNPLKFKGVPVIDRMSNDEINQETPELRISPRGSSPGAKPWYEFMLEIKFKRNNGLPPSPFSFMPGTTKPQPIIQK